MTATMYTMSCRHAATGLVVVASATVPSAVERALPPNSKIIGDKVLVNTRPVDWDRLVRIARSREEPTFITTAHPGVLDHVSFRDADDLRLRVLKWSPERSLEELTENVAASLWEYYDVGIESVGQILTTRGFYGLVAEPAARPAGGGRA